MLGFHVPLALYAPVACALVAAACCVPTKPDINTAATVKADAETIFRCERCIAILLFKR
jgi:hypothetical protein